MVGGWGVCAARIRGTGDGAEVQLTRLMHDIPCVAFCTMAPKNHPSIPLPLPPNAPKPLCLGSSTLTVGKHRKTAGSAPCASGRMASVRPPPHKQQHSCRPIRLNGEPAWGSDIPVAPAAQRVSAWYAHTSRRWSDKNVAPPYFPHTNNIGAQWCARWRAPPHRLRKHLVLWDLPTHVN